VTYETSHEMTMHRSMALALASLDYWPDLDHEARRFAYETVSDMQRLGVPVEQYEYFLDWLSRTGVAVGR
jgi:hypothetical protein